MKRPTPPKKDPFQVEFYEGLVRKTSARYAPVVGEEFEDCCQILRIKCWRALESFDASKTDKPVQNYVFSCVRNQVKDLLKRKRRDEVFIEDIAPSAYASDEGRGAGRERFEAKYLTETEDQAFAELLAETPLIPSTLSDTERKVLVCLYMEYQHREIASALSISMRAVAAAVRAIKEKMADWKPSANGHGISEGGTVERSIEQEQLSESS